MDNSLENPRSRDIERLYVEIERDPIISDGGDGKKVVVDNGSLNRNRRSSVSRRTDSERVDFGGFRKRKAKREASLSSFEPVFKKRKKALEGGTGLKSGGPNLKPKKQQLSGFLSVGNSQILKENVAIKVETFSKKEFQSGARVVADGRNHGIEQVGTSSRLRKESKSSFGAQRSKLSGDSSSQVEQSVGKGKKVSCESEVNGLDGDNLIRFNGNFSHKKTRSGRKRRRSVTENILHVTVGSLVGNSATLCQNSTGTGSSQVQIDYQENLEQNAARMLSSRFSPSCDSFVDDARGSGSKSAYGLSPSAPFEDDFESLGSNSISKKFPIDAAGRVLRPRIYKQNGAIKRRGRFVEIGPGGLDAYLVLNRRIKVLWPLDESWYLGFVVKYDPETKLHNVKYDDRDEDWISLQTERFKILLFPGEIPHQASSSHKKLCLEGKYIDGYESAKDGASMESEPIISWLTRANHRVDSSPLGAPKTQKRSRLSRNMIPPNSSYTSVISQKKLALTSSLLQDRPAERERHAIQEEQSCSTSSGYKKTTYFYFRKRFGKRGQGLSNNGRENSSKRNGVEHMSFLASILAMIEAEKESILRSSEAIDLPADVNKPLASVEPEVLKEFNSKFDTSHVNYRVQEYGNDIGLDEPFDGLGHLGCESFLCSGESIGMLKLAVFSMELDQIKLNLTSLPLWVFSFASNVDRCWTSAVLLLQFGTLIAVWPKVYLEILFIDNTAGLRFLLFDGCLGQAVAFLCLILETFKGSPRCTDVVGGQLPVTSIRFKLSVSQGPERQFVFMFYNFSRLTSSRRQDLDITLKRYCSTTKELSLAECTCANIKIIQSRRDQLPGVLDKRSKEGFTHVDNSKALSHVNRGCPSRTYINSLGKSHPFVLTFADAPTSFLRVHLKLLMESTKNISNNLQNCDLSPPQNGPENFDKLRGGVYCSLVEDSDHLRETSFEIMECSLDNCADSGCLSCSHSKVDTDACPISNDDDWMKSSQQSLNNKLNVTGTSVGLRDLEKNHSDSPDGNIIHLQRRACLTGSWRYTGKSRSFASKVPPFLYEPEIGRVSSCLNNVKVLSPLGDQTPQNLASELGWNMNGFATRGQNPTAPRSIWHRNRLRTVPPSFAYRSKLLPDETTDSFCNGFVNGYRKPRSQILGSLSFASYDSISKPRTSHQKGFSFRKIKDDEAKKASEDCRSPQRYVESLSCDANVLVTVADRGWREFGAQVVHGSLNHDDWSLLVKFAGSTMYSHKVHQIMQPGTANRYTHAMMWRGGKDWSLEFYDRSQWIIFKEMYAECYNRNIRATSVKSIPIPGVRLIEDAYSDAVAVPFVRSSLKYFWQVGTEIDMAMDPSRVIYDMGSDDEEWIYKSRDSLDISDEMLERAMDTFEKVSYAQQRDDFMSNEILHFVDGVGSTDIMKAIFQHWQQKRQKKGMPLIRQFQPPLWEVYQQQVKEWESAILKLHNFVNDCKEKVGTIEKPPMFAFCMRPRGLEVPNKGSKQRSHRRFAAYMHDNASSRDHDNFQLSGRKQNAFDLGEEKSSVTLQDYGSSDFLPCNSPKVAGCLGTTSMICDGSEQNHNLKFHRNQSKMRHRSPCDFPRHSILASQRTMGKNGVLYRWKVRSPEGPNTKQNQEGFLGHRGYQSSGSDCDETRLRDAECAAKNAMDWAKFKREKSQRLFQKADLLLHKGLVALVTAEAIKASE